MNALVNRLLDFEARFERFRLIVQAIQRQLAALAATPANAISGGSTSSGGQLYWARMPSAISAASGSWPTLTPSTFTSDIYVDVAGTLTLVASSQTVRWFYKDAGISGSLVPVEPVDSGTNWDAIANSCTAV